MRIYKITDEKTFNAALEFIQKCDKLQKENEQKLKDIVPFKWTSYLGHDRQSGFNKLVDYTGFVPSEKLEEIPSGWKLLKGYKDFLVPDKKTKLGKDAAKKISELNRVWFSEIYAVLGIEKEDLRRFTVPHLYLSKDKKEIYFKTDIEQEVDTEKFEEVTITYVQSKLK